MSKRLKIGDTVKWSGTWGKEPAVDAEIEAITICPLNSKHGKDVKSVSWDTINGDNRSVVVSLTNGHWAYDYQIKEKETELEADLIELNK